jgi:uncharacterized protein YhfF
MMENTQTKRFWQGSLTTLPDDHPHHSAAYTAWFFGDSPVLADELLELVLAGVKTATASSAWEFEGDKDPVPQVGDLSVILAGNKTPRCIIKTIEIRVMPFNEVDAQFAADEGEGDRSLAYWRDAHQRYFSELRNPLPRVVVATDG